MKFIFKEESIKNTQEIYYFANDVSFTCEEWNQCDFTIMIGCAYIGIDISLYNKQVLQISGACPKQAWIKKKLEPPNQLKEGKIYLETKEEFSKGTGIYLTDRNIPIYFDIKNNCICIGNYNVKDSDCNVKISSNLIISLSKDKIKSIWINPLKIK